MKRFLAPICLCGFPDLAQGFAPAVPPSPPSATVAPEVTDDEASNPMAPVLEMRARCG